jgi:hypothetical protein
MLATSSVVNAATAFVSWLELLVERTPPLVRLAVIASAAPAGADKAQATFRDELLTLVRDPAEASWRELRRGVDDLDALTRPDGKDAERPPNRPYKAKP